jgi:signal transduction histidine kinase
MRIGGRRKSVIFFLTLGICLVVLALALNVGWILLNWREVALLVFGIIFFVIIITGLVLNTTFLVREIRRNEQHDAFINAVTHELKTPITSIRLYLETLKAREVDETRRREFYDIMLADSDRLLGTVEQVLHAGRTAHKRRLINIAPVDFGQLVGECLDLARLRHNLDGEAIRYVVEAEAEGVSVAGDRDELRAAVSNLVENAVKYSDNRVRVSVELDAPDERHIRVRISDNGIGIHRNQLKRIFKRFYRVQGGIMKRFKGTGLGLFIVRSVVERHGGKVFAESDGVGHGSTFTILLPRA